MGRKEELLVALDEYGAVTTDDHFVYASGKHGGAYVDKDIIYTYPHLTAEICTGMGALFDNIDIDAVVGPEKGGIILSQLVAWYLGFENDVTAFYAEKTEDGGFILKRGGAAERIRGLRVLVVEDNLTTGGSVKKVVDLIRSLGGNVVGVCGMVNRGGVTKEDVGNPDHFKVLFEIPLEMWDEEECPLCKSGIPVNTRLGKGKEFLARQQKKGGP